MTRLNKIAKGFGALVVLGVLIVGIPWALWHFIGWPLPHRLPSWSGLVHDLNQRGIPDRTLIDALAVAVWLTWVVLVASLAAEMPATLAGRSARRLPLAGAFQPLVGHLVAAVLVAALSFAPRPSFAGAASLAGSRPVAAFTLTDAAVPTSIVRAAPGSLPSSSNRAAHREAVSASAPSKVAERTYVVRRGDTLWAIAERECGDALRWEELYRLNAGRPQPDGRTLTDAHWIYPGWTLVLPASSDTPTPAPVKVTPTPTSTPTNTVPSTSSTAQHDRGATSGGQAAAVSPIQTSSEPARAPLNPQVPAVTARPSANTEHERVSASTSVPVPITPIGFGLLGAGLLGVLVRLRRVQQRHRRYGRRIPMPTGDLAVVEQALAPVTDPTAPRFVDRSLRLLRQVLRGGESLPTVLGAVLGSDSIEFILDGDQVAPAPFTNVASDRWRLARDDEQVRTALDDASGALAALPCLVTIGANEDGVVLLNLEAGGAVALEGDSGVASELATAIALELASASWNEMLELVDIEVGTEQVRRDRCTTAASFDEALAALRSHVKLTVVDSASHAMKDASRTGSFASDEPWSRCALVSARALSAVEQEQLDAEFSDPASLGIAVVAPGTLRGARWRLVAHDDGRVEVPPLGRSVQAQRVTTTHLAGIAALLGLAARREDVASDAPPYDRIAPSGPVSVPHVEVSLMFSPEDELASTLEEEPGASTVGGAVETDGPRRIEVGVLGPLAMSGLAATPERSKAAELIAWLVFHDRRGTTDEFATALWPMGASEGTHHNVIWDARRALGNDDGGAPLLVRDGDLYLSSLVSSDVTRFHELATSSDAATRFAALALVRGKPFGDVDWSWATGEGIAASIEAEVCDLASSLGEQALLDGDVTFAARSAEQGILASPYDERLYRLLMRAHDAAGNPGGIRSAMERLAVVLEAEVEPLESVHPETRALYEALMRRQRVTPSVTTTTPGRRSGWRNRAARTLREPSNEQAVVTELDERRRHSDQRS